MSRTPSDYFYCEDCKEPCEDERALRNIDNCYKAIHNGNCPSNCEVCEYRFREREP